MGHYYHSWSLLGRFEKFYDSNKEAQMIEGEERYHAKLLLLPLYCNYIPPFIYFS